VKLPASTLEWPADALEELAERSAIREYLGKTPRARAERLAEEDVRRAHAGRVDSRSGRDMRRV
jgi:hypothetical protein